MKGKQRLLIISLDVLLTVWLLFVSPSMAQDTQKQDKQKQATQRIEQLERLIKEQQKQMESMQSQLDQLNKTALDTQNTVDQAKQELHEGFKHFLEDHKEDRVGFPSPPPETITSGNKRVKLSISGQVNRAMSIVSDGDKTKRYFVDNDASNTRIRFLGTAKVNDDLTIGSRIEVALAPNESGDVSQNDEESGDFYDERWVEVSFTSKRFGKISLGKGDTASNNSAEVDLSRTDVVQYASIADIAGGMLFRQRSDDVLTTVRVSDAFRDEDGLSRKTRLRYDTPKWHGFSLAGSLVSDQRWDSSLWWGGQGLGFKAAGAVSYADPNEVDIDNQYDGSFSILHESTGLNLTMSGGMKDRDNQGNPINLWGKVGWMTRFFSFGQTAFGVDYARSKNLPTEDDDGYSVGVAAVQHFEEYGIELYTQYRHYSLDRDAAPSVYDIDVATMGVRVKF